MKQIFTLLLIVSLLAISVPAQNSKVQGYAEKGGQVVTISGVSSANKFQQSFPNCTITIYNAGTTNLATIYTNSTGTPKSNPFTADSTGFWSFFGTTSSSFDVRFSGTGIATPFTIGGYVAGGGGGSTYTDPMTTIGDTIYRNGSNVTSRLPIGTSGQVYTVSGGLPTWADNTTTVAYQQYVGTYGAVGDGTTNDRTAIANTITASYTGGATIFVAKTYAVTTGLTVGNGTGNYATGTATASTLNSIVIDGQGATIKYTGSSTSGAVLSINGPIYQVILKNITIDCNALAAIGLDLNHVAESRFENVYIKNNTGTGIRHRAYANPSGTSNGANNDVFDNVWVNSTQTGASGISIGYTDTVASPRLDVAQNTFINCRFRFDGASGTTYGIILNFTDACSWINTIVSASVALHVVVPSGTAGSSYPSNHTFINPALTGPNGADPNDGGCDISGSWAGTWGIYFQNYQTADQEPLPPLIPNQHQLFSGIDDTGATFGFPLQHSLYYSTVTTSTAIASTTTETAFSVSYSIPAYVLYKQGAMVRISASGTYSTTGTPTLTVRTKLGGSTLADPLAITANNAVGYHWSLSSAGVVRFLGVGGVMELGPNWLGLGGSGLATGATSGNFSLNTNVANAVTITITWSASSASNTIVLDTLTVEILYPGTFN
jgi:hypothetical protein